MFNFFLTTYVIINFLCSYRSTNDRTLVYRNHGVLGADKNWHSKFCPGSNCDAKFDFKKEQKVYSIFFEFRTYISYLFWWFLQLDPETNVYCLLKILARVPLRTIKVPVWYNFTTSISGPPRNLRTPLVNSS